MKTITSKYFVIASNCFIIACNSVYWITKYLKSNLNTVTEILCTASIKLVKLSTTKHHKLWEEVNHPILALLILQFPLWDLLKFYQWEDTNQWNEKLVANKNILHSVSVMIFWILFYFKDIILKLVCCNNCEIGNKSDRQNGRWVGGIVKLKGRGPVLQVVALQGVWGWRPGEEEEQERKQGK